MQVNGIEWSGSWSSRKTEVYLNKGINSIQLTSLTEGEIAEDITVAGVSRNQAAGAQVLYTAYEAERGQTNGQIHGDGRTYRTIPSEASQRSYVELKNAGDYVSVTLENDATALVIRCCIPDSADGAGLDTCAILDVGGDTYDPELTSRYSWVYGAYPWNNDNVVIRGVGMWIPACMATLPASLSGQATLPSMISLWLARSSAAGILWILLPLI